MNDSPIFALLVDIQGPILEWTGLISTLDTMEIAQAQVETLLYVSTTRGENAILLTEPIEQAALMVLEAYEILINCVDPEGDEGKDLQDRYSELRKVTGDQMEIVRQRIRSYRIKNQEATA